MPTETRSSAHQWLWFLLIWAAGVALFGVVVFLLRSLQAAITAS